jgi:uncharacterized protein
MRIELDKLEELGGKIAQTYEIAGLGLDDNECRLVEPAQVRGRIQRHGTEVELRGELQTTVEIPCGRCLKPVVLPLNQNFSERFVSEVNWRAEEQHELGEQDLNLAVFDGQAIELDDLVREEILLALPGHVLCREDCKGLCAGCGADLNLGDCGCESKEIDTRWKGLKDLRL